MKGANTIVDSASGKFPIDISVFLFEDWCQRCLRRILRCWMKSSRDDSVYRSLHKITTQ